MGLCGWAGLGWILGSLSQELYVGQVYSKIASEVWSTILAKDPLPKDAFYVVSKEESHKRLHPGSSGANFERNPSLSKQSGNNNKRFNANSEVSQSVLSTSGSLVAVSSNSRSNKQKQLAEVSMSVMYNVTLGWIIDSGANQHMTDSTKDMFNFVDISSLMLTVGHPNGTLAKNTAINSPRLTSGIVLFDVLVHPEFNVSLLYVNKIIKVTKFFVGFYEHKCYIQYFCPDNIVGTGSESGGLYLFHIDKIGKYVSAKSNFVFVCHVSSGLWHYILGHLADQGLSILDINLGFSKKDHISPYNICHKAKQTREPFPLSDHNSTFFGDIIHCDVLGPYMVVSKDRLPSSFLSGVSPYFLVYGKDPGLSHVRQRVLPSKFSDYVVSSNVKYGLKKYVCYDNLSSRNLCFSTNLNMYTEPKTFHEASQNPKWIEAMNLEMKAFHRNITYVLVDLPLRRKDIKYLGLLRYFLGIEVLENENGLCLSQRKYCLELLSEYGRLACKPAANPLQ
nr:ribonuclease H-like domain-containing protein [Tanacetum cinerariifolium]